MQSSSSQMFVGVLDATLILEVQFGCSLSLYAIFKFSQQFPSVFGTIQYFAYLLIRHLQYGQPQIRFNFGGKNKLGFKCGEWKLNKKYCNQQNVNVVYIGTFTQLRRNSLLKKTTSPKKHLYCLQLVLYVSCESLIFLSNTQQKQNCVEGLSRPLNTFCILRLFTFWLI